TRSGRRWRSRPYRSLQRAERVASPSNGRQVRCELAVSKILEGGDDRRGRCPSRIHAGDPYLMLGGRFGRGSPALTDSLRQREQAPVDKTKGRSGGSVVARRAPANRAPREERTQRRPKR